MLEYRVRTLEAGLREALLHLNGSVGFRLPHSPPSNPPPADFQVHSHNLTYNLTYALKELEAMKFERENGMYLEHGLHDHNNHGDSTSTIYEAGSKTNVEIEDLATSPPASERQCPVDSTDHFLPSAGDCVASNTFPNVLTARDIGTGDPRRCEITSVSWLSLLVTEEVYFSHSNAILFGP
jgi:hypothetical protein